MSGRPRVHTPPNPGQVIGAWTVLAPAPRTSNRLSRWWCRCMCGKEKMVYEGVLLKGVTRSCGCWIKYHTAITKIFDSLGEMTDAHLDYIETSLSRLLTVVQREILRRQKKAA